MEGIQIGLKEEPVKRVEPISKSLTLWSGAIVLFILIVTLVSLVIIPSPDGDGDAFLIYLLRNMNLL